MAAAIHDDTFTGIREFLKGLERRREVRLFVERGNDQGNQANWSFEIASLEFLFSLAPLRILAGMAFAHFRKLTIFVLAVMLAGSAIAQRQDFKWQVFTIAGRDYIPAKDIAEFYETSSMQDVGGEVRFLWPAGFNLMMVAKAESQTLIINKIKFITSFRMIRDGGQLLISRMDLSKLIDPVLRPKRQKTVGKFDTVIIDPGHGGSDSGAVCELGKESDFALDTARHLANLLKARGYKAYLTRDTDEFITLGQRVEFANKYQNAILVSLHYNSGQSRASGLETFALSPQGASSTFAGERRSDGVKFDGNSRDAENIALATAIHASALNNIRSVDRGIKRARWTVLTGLKLPGILFEGGFLSNPSEAQKVATDTYRKTVARAVFEGIENYRRALSKTSS